PDSWRGLPAEIAIQRVAAEACGLGEAECLRIERELQREAVDETEHDGGGPDGIDGAEATGPHALGDEATDQASRPRVHGGVEIAQTSIVQHLAPELDEHDPELRTPHRDLQAGPHQRTQAGRRIAAGTRLR